ncbi:TonB-dependent receptor [Paucibacter sp. R3-3]|uniref:TonB-dependent receptor n=1 Tax=Roseateles agri TaxID=3098619 RepID=A0ABU5DRC1_9BURK|nr:TonB-dependent receptor [Paucibacter sp. R3-3]MDY0748868.1 TonB-dependent receptor [Paucibacter sp. R3-3]
MKLNPIYLAVVASMAAIPAHAQQDASQQLERVVVTGSNIKRIDAEGANPILAITREEISNSGKATLTEYLQSLSLDGQGSLPTGFGNGFAAGATAISLRGLGANATLVLLNGRRLAPYPRADDFQKMFADLSTIPLEAVERIEVLKDGASAIYGSDALAGVVNIILRRNFNGIVGKVEAGSSRYGDGNRTKAALTMGAGDLASDKWNGLLNIEVSKNDEIHYRDRNREYIGKGDVRPWGYDAFATQWTDGYQTGNTVRPTPAGIIRNPNTLAYQLVSPCTSAIPGAIQPGFDGDNGCSFDFGQFRSFQPKLQNLSIFARGSVALGDAWEAYAELSYGKNKTGFDVSLLTTPGTIIGPYGLRGYGTGINVPELTLAAEHPDNPFGTPVRFRYAFGEFGPQRRTNDSDISRIVAGVKGTAAGWDIDAGVMHSESKLDQVYTVLSTQGVMDAFHNPGSATFGYRMGANAGLNTAAQRASLLVNASSASKTTLDIVDAKASRELMTLPGGPMGLAIGTEYRKLKLVAPSLSGTEDGSVMASYNGFFGDEKTWAVYSELLAPVLKGVELTGAVRYDHYASFDSTTPKLAVKFTPMPQLVLRASYSEGFRAPNPAEASPQAQATFSSSGAHDPIRCPGGVLASGATQADCTGSAAGGISQGNPDLKPEKSKNTNFGFVAEPVKGMTFGADFWQIKKRDQIQTISFQEAFDRPDVVRSDNNLPGIPNSGSIIVAYAPFINAGSTTVSGVDVDASYRWTVAEVGRFKADLHWTRYRKWELVNDGVTHDYVGTHGNCDVSNCIGTPKDKANVAVTWETATFGLTGVLNWRSSIKNTAEKADDTCLSLGRLDGSESCAKLPSFYTLDLTGRWNITKSLQLYGSIQNVFDRVAPLDTVTYGGINYNPMDVSGAMGRYYSLGLKYQFK